MRDTIDEIIRAPYAAFRTNKEWQDAIRLMRAAPELLELCAMIAEKKHDDPVGGFIVGAAKSLVDRTKGRL